MSLGALWGVSQDGRDRWRSRGRRIAGVAVTSSVGMLMGAIVAHGQGSFGVVLAVLTATALVAGFIEASGLASQGMYLILGAVVGTGLPAARQPVEAAAAILVGVLWVYGVAWLSDRRTRAHDERTCVAAAFRDLAGMIDALGTEKYEAARQRTLLSLDTAQDVVGAADLSDKNEEFLALYQCFVVALQFGELTALLHVNEIEVKSGSATTLREVAGVIAERGGRAGRELLARAHESYVEQGFRRVAAALRAPDIATLRGNPPFRTSLSLLPWAERFRFAVLLTFVTVAGTLLAHWLHGPKSYWLPMTSIFIFRPDTGPVVKRALARTGGTLAGVAIAAGVVWLGNSSLILIVLCCAMATAVPFAQRRSYALTVMCFTPIVFVFIGLLRSTSALLGARVLDTLIGAVIVLGLDFVFWTRAPSLRPAQQLERATLLTQEYLTVTPLSPVVERHVSRRKALRAVSRAHEAFQLAELESRTPRSQLPNFEQHIAELRRRIDEHAASLFEAVL